MRRIYDTNVIIDAGKGVPDASNAIRRAALCEWAGLSSMSRIEALGFPRITPDEEKKLAALIAQLVEVDISGAIVDEAIRIRRSVTTKTADAVIAATGLLNNADLITRNVDGFKNISGLTVIHPADA